MSSRETLSPRVVLEELDHILRSAAFRAAPRASRFLRYVVEETLAGNGENIKEYLIGTAVFDRSDSFDPRNDPIVRVEALRLRAKLKEYYETEGRPSGVVISIPKGRYTPVFEERGTAVRPRSRHRKLWIVAPALVVLIVAIWLVESRQSMAPDIVSIAVLPFRNLSADPENQYFSDGLAEELTDRLARTGSIKVASRMSAFQFGSESADIAMVGQRLGVRYVVEGSVRQSGEVLRIAVQIINVADGYHLWSKQFDRRNEEVLSVQSEIAESVVQAMQVRLSGQQTDRLTRRYTDNIAAFDSYLRGRHAMWGPDGQLASALRFFEKAVEEDPNYARAYAAIAQWHVVNGLILGGQDILEKSRMAAEKALTIDPDLAEAHAYLGEVHAKADFDWEAAEREFQWALALNPGSADAHNYYAQDYLLPRGRFEEALAESRKAQELDPMNPMIAAGYPWIMAMQGDTQAAIDTYLRLIEQTPNPAYKAALGMTYTMDGRYERAIETLEGMGGTFKHFLGYNYARADNRVEAERILKELSAEPASSGSSARIALVQMGLGNHDQALHHLELAWQARHPSLIFLRVNTLFAPLMSDPRYQQLLRMAGLFEG